MDALRFPIVNMHTEMNEYKEPANQIMYQKHLKKHKQASLIGSEVPSYLVQSVCSSEEPPNPNQLRIDSSTSYGCCDGVTLPC